MPCQTVPLFSIPYVPVGPYGKNADHSHSFNLSFTVTFENLAKTIRNGKHASRSSPTIPKVPTSLLPGTLLQYVPLPFDIILDIPAVKTQKHGVWNRCSGFTFSVALCMCFFLSLTLIRGNYTNLHVLYTIARLPIRPASWPFHTVQGFFFFPPSPVFPGIYMVRMTGFLSGMENMGLGNRWTDGAGMGWDGIIRLGFFWA